MESQGTGYDTSRVREIESKSRTRRFKPRSFQANIPEVAIWKVAVASPRGPNGGRTLFNRGSLVIFPVFLTLSHRTPVDPAGTHINKVDIEEGDCAS